MLLEIIDLASSADLLDFVYTLYKKCTNDQHSNNNNLQIGKMTKSVD